MDGCLDLGAYPKLQGADWISKKDAKKKAIDEYSEFRIKQDKQFIGGFEKAATKAIGNKGDRT